MELLELKNKICESFSGSQEELQKKIVVVFASRTRQAK